MNRFWEAVYYFDIFIGTCKPYVLYNALSPVMMIGANLSIDLIGHTGLIKIISLSKLKYCQK